ncbi:hypothetical protein CY0110_15912 [Crocosphaera chwakensis CCY0110]|uniref:Uncharacterized protein n=1 Tax=Crocosphaera chwakensis CCY0110 TaxID=391612 RepID=A3IHL4_9CHRO|nr:hypothetical protein CY0110_15912 [Crocosphaera chwakensis CCY0110]
MKTSWAKTSLSCWIWTKKTGNSFKKPMSAPAPARLGCHCKSYLEMRC